jgi:hypothetical protein
MEQIVREKIWLYKSSIIFIDKLLRDNMISKQEYNDTQKKLKEIYGIFSIPYPQDYEKIK